MHKLFPSQGENEKIYIITRESPYRLAFKFFVVFVLAFVPLGVHYLVFTVAGVPQTDGTALLYQLFSTLYFMGTLIAAFFIYILYYLNLYIVSEQRVVDIDQVGLLFHQASELNIETIEDVTSETKGLIGNLLNYGTVFIQTAGAQERFEFDNVSHPEEIASVILRLYEEHEKKESPKP